MVIGGSTGRVTVTAAPVGPALGATVATGNATVGNAEATPPTTPATVDETGFGAAEGRPD